MELKIVNGKRGKFNVKIKGTVIADLVDGVWVNREFNTVAEAKQEIHNYKKFHEGK